MDLHLEAFLTVLANIGGYAFACVVIVHAVRMAEGNFVVGFPKAATALFVLWVMVLAWYVGSMYWLGTYPHAEPPDWLESSSGIAENNQSEILQVWLASLIFKYLPWPGSPESKE